MLASYWLAQTPYAVVANNPTAMIGLMECCFALVITQKLVFSGEEVLRVVTGVWEPVVLNPW